jgi:hypothetical protein
MACRLSNRSAQTLRIDLRGGASLLLAPGATSAALLEEQLYDNMFLAQWEREGWLVRLPARAAEVGVTAPVATVARPPVANADEESKKPPRKKSKGGNES